MRVQRGRESNILSQVQNNFSEQSTPFNVLPPSTTSSKLSHVDRVANAKKAQGQPQGRES